MDVEENTIFDCWQNFLACIALHMLLPLLPLLLELWFAGKVEAKSAALTAALYSMAIGLSSQFIGLLGVGFAFGFVFSAVFGYLSTEPPGLEHALDASAAATLFMFVMHAIERYYLHVRWKEEFFEFLRNKRR